MNREIKFRAFHIKEQRMFEVADIIFYEANVCELVTKNKGMMGLEHEVLIEHEFDDVTLMQFTGLVDKHDKDIYDGDILKYDGEKEKCEKCGHVTWKYTDHKPYLIKWELSAFTCENDENWMSPEEFKDTEIIGDIYSNPELLQEK